MFQTTGWWPSLTRASDGHIYLAYGNTAVTVVCLTDLVNGRPRVCLQIPFRTYAPAQWITPDKVTWRVPIAGTADCHRLEATVGVWQPVQVTSYDPAGLEHPANLAANQFLAADGHWGVWRGSAIFWDNRRLGAGHGLALAGDRLATFTDANHTQIAVYRQGQLEQVYPVRGAGAHGLALAPDGQLYVGGAGPQWEVRQPEPWVDRTVAAAGWEGGATVFAVQGVRWLASAGQLSDGTWGVYLRPADAQEVIEVPTPASALAVLADGDAVYVAANDAAGVLRCRVVPAWSPRHRVRPFYESLARPVWAGYFYQHSDRYGDNPTAPGSCSIVVEPGPVRRADRPLVLLATHVDGTFDPAQLAQAVDRWDRVAAIYLSHEVGESRTRLPETARAVRQWVAARGLPQRPLTSYTSANAFIPEGIDWPGAELYVDPALSTLPRAEFVRAVTRQFRDRLKMYAASGKPLAIWCQAYSRNGVWANLTTLEALQGLWHAMVVEFPAIRLVGWFSDGRPTGTRDHPSLRMWHEALVRAVRVPPIETGAEDAMPLKPPKVTVTRFDGVIKPHGWETEFTDRENPTLGLKVRLVTRNGSLYMEIEHAGGKADTGVYRKIL